jgi:hypothetical protein
MERKFEPGPWILGGCSGRKITTPSGYCGDGFIADVDTKANAHLIAAAPDLLEALELILPNIEALATESFGSKFLETYKPVLQAREAIAKALGKEVSHD